MRAVPRIRMRINVHLCVFAYIFIYLRQMHRARLYSTGPLHIYVLTRIAVVYLKRLTMAIAMVGGGDDTGGSGYTRDRLGESLGTERGEIGKREEGCVGERVTGRVKPLVLQAKKRDGKQTRCADGGSREIETERRSGREAESRESSGTSSCRSRGGWLLS